MPRIIFTCALLFLLGLCGEEVNAVFNITRIALDLSTSVREQVEKNNSYHSEKDARNQIRLVSTMLEKFYNQSKNFKATINFDFSICRWPDEESFLHICLKLEDYLRKNDYLSEYFYDFNDPRVSDSIRENDYNLLDKTFNEILNEYHTMISTPDPCIGMSLVDLITMKQAKCVYHCQSRQQSLYNLIKMIASMDARGFARRQFSYASFKIQLDAADVLSDFLMRDVIITTEHWSDKNMTAKMVKAEREFFTRNENTYRKLDSLLSSLDRNVYGCPRYPRYPFTEHSRGPNKLPAIFQKYIINEGDMDERSSCSKTCSDFRKAKVHGCYDKSICDRQPTCNGTLWDCDSMGSPVWMCPSDKSSPKRFQFFKVDDNYYGENYYGKNQPVKDLSYCRGSIVKAESWTRGFVECTYCMCTCENNINQDRYFSLRPALSDTNSNHVVTGLKWLKENGIWHIQIQEGKLLSNGVIALNLEWKPVDNFKINDPYVAVGTDYYDLTWRNRTVLLDSLSAPKDYVLTGLQFVSFDNYLKLKIRVTRFDFVTGELLPQQTQWLFNAKPLKDRTELDLEKLQDCLYDELKKDAYFRFTTSSLEIDAGQSVVPAINLETVETNPPVPLSGAGIYLKNASGGVQLNFKMETYDFAPYVVKNKNV